MKLEITYNKTLGSLSMPNFEMESLQFEEEYFEDVKYRQRKRLIQRYVKEVLRWGSKISKSNLLDGRGRTALDVGCAYGYGIEVLKSCGYKVVGADLSKHGIREAKKSCTTDFVICDVQEKLPFKDKSFYLVTCFQVLEHLLYPLDAIRYIFDSCEEILIFTTPNKVVERPVKKLVRDFDKSHISLKSPGEWKNIIQETLKEKFVKVETFFDLNLKVGNKVFFKSFKLPYLGLDVKILIKRERSRTP